MMVSVLRFLITLTFAWAATALPGPAGAQALNTAADANAGRIGLISGSPGGTYIQFATDMARVLDQRGTMRVLAIVGQGSVQNIEDLIYLRGIDLAIVQSDVLEVLRQGNYDPRLDEIEYMTTLYDEEVHILGLSTFDSIADLEGAQVNIGSNGSGTYVTASNILNILGIHVEPTYESASDALAMLQHGQIDAMVYVVGQPAGLFAEIDDDQGIHLIEIPCTERLRQSYRCARLGEDSYPRLFSRTPFIETVAVTAVLANYGFRPTSAFGRDRFAALSQFAERFVAHFSEFQRPGRHEKWADVTLNAELANWRRFPPFQDALGGSGLRDGDSRPPAPTVRIRPPVQ